ncbi:hypothetical protein LTR94_026684 [Friedmanniomyces endolithicus]|nr:hypothetical protein LTR94_026684 [Friedmanniomyces endolithicus]
MKTRKLGPSGPEVSAIGLGCMGMSAFYGGSDEAQSIKVIHRALELGVSFLDTAEMYGPHTNEVLVGKALKDRRDQAFLATKFGINYNADRTRLMTDGSPANVRRAIEGSLSRLGVDHVDLYYLHRVDPDTPIEDTVGAQWRSLSRRVRRAHSVHPITALQTEYSLWTRDPEDALFAVTRELGVGFVPYSPLGRGFLSGQIKSIDDLDADDFRRTNPRFMGENFQKNLDLVDAVTALAADKGMTAAQLALAWVLHQGEDLVPIPGTRRLQTLEENIGAVDLQLTDQDAAAIEAVFPKGAAVGHRYAEAARAALNR